MFLWATRCCGFCWWVDFVSKTAASYSALLEVMSSEAREFFEKMELVPNARKILEDWSKSRGSRSIAWVVPMTGNLLSAYRDGLAEAAAEYGRKL